MLQDFKLGQTSIVLRVLIRDSSSASWSGLSGLTNSSSGLLISGIADNEASATTYSAAGGTIDSVTTLGTFAAPSSGHCRFKEVDATNLKGLYELQLDNARFAVSGAKSLTVCISGPANASPCWFSIPLRSVDPYDAVRFGLTALPNVASGSAGSIPTTGSGSNQISLSGGAVALQANQAVNATQLAGQTVSASSSVSFPASVGTSTLTQAQVTGGAYALATDSGGNVKISAGAGSGQLDIASGLVKANDSAGNALATASTAAAIKSQTDLLLFDSSSNVKANTQATASTLSFNQTGNVSGSVGSVTGAVIVGTNNDKTGYSLSSGMITSIQSGLATSSAQSGLAATLGTPAGASLSADVASIKSDTAKIGQNSGDSPNQQTAQSTIAANLDAAVSSRTSGNADTPGTTTLLTRLPQAIAFSDAGNVKSEPQTNVTVGSYASGQAPPTTNQIAAAILQNPSNLLLTDSDGDVRFVDVGNQMGSGSTPINHDTGGTDNLRYVDSLGQGISEATVLIYLASDWPANPANVLARSTTGADGRWLTPAYVDPGSYVAVFTKIGVAGPDASGAFTV